MRTYSGYLLLENILDAIPSDNPLVKSVATRVISPVVKVVEADCGTALGEVGSLNFTSQGFTELATGEQLTRERIVYLLSKGRYTLAFRNLHTCQSEGGICAACYKASFPENATPAVGKSVQIINRFVLAEEVIPLMEGQTEYTRSNSYSSLEYDDISVFCDNADLTFSTTESMLVVGGSPTDTDSVLVRYYANSARPIMAMFAKTYSGSLLGMKPISSYKTTLKPSLLRGLISEGVLDTLQDNVLSSDNVPSNIERYIPTVADPLERALLLITLYCVYG